MPLEGIGGKATELEETNIVSHALGGPKGYL